MEGFVKVGLAVIIATVMTGGAAIVVVENGGSELRVNGASLVVEAGTGSSEAAYSYTPDQNGRWRANLENHGLESVKIIVLDASRPQDAIYSQLINFELAGAVPTGTVVSDQVWMRGGVQHTIIAKDPVGEKGAFAVITDMWSQDPPPEEQPEEPPEEPETPWTGTVTVATNRTFNSLAMATTENGIYLTSWEWPYGAVSAFASDDGGKSWSEGTGLTSGVGAGFSDICAYSVGSGQDVVLVVAGDGCVYKSEDNGLTYSLLASLPLGEAFRWSYMAIGTNASWTGAPVDSDIYVFGSRVVGDYYGQFYLSFTKSTDGGATWSPPLQICSFQSYYPEVTSDGTNLYMIFNQLDLGEGYASVFAMTSSDWGNTWTTPTMIFQRTYTSGGANPCTLEYIGDGKALVTISDHLPNAYDQIKGTWGVLDLENLTLEVKGFVMGPDWQVDLGFCAHLTPDHRLAVAWLYRQPTSELDDILFTYMTDFGF